MTLTNALTRIQVEAVLREQLDYTFMDVVAEGITVVNGHEKRLLNHAIEVVALHGVYRSLDILLAPHWWLRWPPN